MPEVAAFRRRLSESAGALGDSNPERDVLEAARDDVSTLLRSWIDRELHELFEERDVALRDLELDLDVALAEALAGGAQPAAEERPQ
jgi:hypothetical protein